MAMENHQPTLADLCERSTLNQVAIDCINMPVFYGLAGSGIAVAMLSGVWLAAPAGIALAFFDAWNNTRASIRKERDIRANPGAWKKYSGVPTKELEAKRDLLATPIAVLDQQIKFRQDASLSLPAYSPAQPQEASELLPLSAYLKYFLYAPLAVIGPQGSGKSTILRLVADLKKQAGHQVKILNPHAMPADWQGYEVIGGGHNFDEVNAFLEWYPGELKSRYAEGYKSGLGADEFRDKLAAEGRALSIICDEISNWVGSVDPELHHGFVLSSIAESRKVVLPPVFGLHGDKLHDYGLKQGADRKDAALVKLLLDEGQPDPATGQIIAAGTGTIRLANGKEFRFSFSKPGTVAAIEADEEESLSIGDRMWQFANAIKTAVDAPSAPANREKELIDEYREIYPQCRHLSDVIDRMGNKLFRAGLINRRTALYVRQWLHQNDLPIPGDQEPEPEHEPQTVAPPPRRRS